jgi:hypothetical protein
MRGQPPLLFAVNRAAAGIFHWPWPDAQATASPADQATWRSGLISELPSHSAAHNHRISNGRWCGAGWLAEAGAPLNSPTQRPAYQRRE